MNSYHQFIYKINSKTATIAVIGLGYVGLPLALEFSKKGFKTIGFDIDEGKIPLLMSGQSYIKHIPSEKIALAVKSQLFSATTDFSRIKETDAILLCVPTPLDEHREPDLTYVKNSAELVAQFLRKGQLVVLESSTYPGTTEEILLPLFEDSGLVEGNKKFEVGEDFFLAFSPEREDPNNPNYSTSTIPKVVGGTTSKCLEIACLLYDQIIIKTVPVSSTRVAEATKLLENIYRSVNIALMNELKMVFDKMKIDVWEVIEAAKTKPFGFQAFYPGPGLGGHCIPIDPFYLTWKAREYDISTKFIELAGEINTYQPYYVAEKVISVLNQNCKSIKGAKILILGVSYKRNIDDKRESPSLKLIEIFQNKDAKVDFSDPYAPQLTPSRKYDYNIPSINLSAKNLSSYDLVLLSTDHDNFDYELIAKNSKLIVDTRNAFERHGIKSPHIYKS
ncbi:MAG: nucleotide sugar dehydrogenase [Ignavibacteriales bacterium]|nr:nucleotide sugar dehydrogenase [Ignavibacteriales bacterium]